MRPHPCCNEQENLTRVELSPTSYAEVCQVCHARHTVAYFDPGVFGLVGGKVGG